MAEATHRMSVLVGLVHSAGSSFDQDQFNPIHVFPFWVSCPEAHGFPACTETLHGMVHWLVPQICHEIKIVQHSFYLHCDLQFCEGLGQADVVPV